MLENPFAIGTILTADTKSTFSISFKGQWISAVAPRTCWPALDFPPNRAITKGRFGPRPLDHTHWITVCGGRDPNPEPDGCPGMRATGEWLVNQGAEVVEVIEDTQGGHGAFHRNPQNVNRALDIFQTSRLNRRFL